ncbi:uncharacterized protein TRIADDRAFT_27600 [Trichoplax adhaerens]|uniref:Nucleolar GTP-binding protein 2 n=1 Tax=Trichoplax adhaerens TaxID=10228 RepID=B3S265_TRIAD|nr:hypothetical protein TRIADDRAFT_27600 [Trichoplax adhaerens]EDV23379.1 hypothetical protein TRIADDRAFT_27600 [Trichoplax adhaerens]|eukprot:XP_002114289.1 hypothetical protein TRIADDRAFT_27600 [Trichoplax adhaerens]
MGNRKRSKKSGGDATFNKSTASTNPDRPKPAAGSRMRDKATVKRLNMYRDTGRSRRNSSGKIVKRAAFQSYAESGSVARIEPNRKWFGNTKVIAQNALQKFQAEMGKVSKDPFQVILRQSKLPMSLLRESTKQKNRAHILDVESFENTFGPKARRKKPSIQSEDLQARFNKIAYTILPKHYYDANQDKDLERATPDTKDETQEMIFTAGQSKRIWNELYKVIDSSDVIAEVLDARDPMGTRCKNVENYLAKEKPHKNLIFILNKCDLVPTWATSRWVGILSKEKPTVAFHASMTNPFGKGSLINVLRQFGKLHKDKKQISVGFIGYPNVGKSSVINALRAKKVCSVAPIAGETKVWQYITLMKRIFLIDCPGVVYPADDSETDIILKGVVRVEKVKEPSQYIQAVLDRVKPEYILNTYKIQPWNDAVHFLEQIAKKAGKLLKGGECDLNSVARMILNDWQRGKLPYFVSPPKLDDEQVTETKEAIPSDKIISTDNSEGVLTLKDTTLESMENNLEVCPSDKEDNDLKTDEKSETSSTLSDGDDDTELSGDVHLNTDLSSNKSINDPLDADISNVKRPTSTYEVYSKNNVICVVAKGDSPEADIRDDEYTTSSEYDSN